MRHSFNQINIGDRDSRTLKCRVRRKPQYIGRTHLQMTAKHICPSQNSPENILRQDIS